MAKAKSKEKSTGTHTVKVEFRDIKDFNKVYSVGDDVSHLEEGRLKTLTELGYVTKGEAEKTDE